MGKEKAWSERDNEERRDPFQYLDLCPITPSNQLGHAAKLHAKEEEEIGLANT